jgi:ribonuclease P protein component
MTFFYLAAGTVPGSPSNAAVAFDGMKGPARAAVRIGFTVPRALGGAVDRNRIRRRTREAVRHNFYALLANPSRAMDIVINPRKSVLKADFVKLSQEVAAAFAALRRGAGVAASSGPAAGTRRGRSGAKAEVRGRS